MSEPEEDHVHHGIDYVELTVPDLAEARRFYSADLDATAAAVTDAGGRVVEGPYPFPGGRRLHFTDPGGTELGVWALR